MSSSIDNQDHVPVTPSPSRARSKRKHSRAFPLTPDSPLISGNQEGTGASPSKRQKTQTAASERNQDNNASPDPVNAAMGTAAPISDASASNYVYLVMRIDQFDFEQDPPAIVEIYTDYTDANNRVRNECPTFFRNDPDHFKEGTTENGTLWWDYVDYDGFGRRFHVEVKEVKPEGSVQSKDWGRPFGEPAPRVESDDDMDLDSESEEEEVLKKKPAQEKPWYELERERSLSPLRPPKPRPVEKEAVHISQVGKKQKLVLKTSKKGAKDQRGREARRSKAEIHATSEQKRAQEQERKANALKQRKMAADAKKAAQKKAAEDAQAAKLARKIADEEKNAREAILKVADKAERPRLAEEQEVRDEIEAARLAEEKEVNERAEKELQARLENVRSKAEQKRLEEQEAIEAAAEKAKQKAKSSSERAKRAAATRAENKRLAAEEEARNPKPEEETKGEGTKTGSKNAVKGKHTKATVPAKAKTRAGPSFYPKSPAKAKTHAKGKGKK